MTDRTPQYQYIHSRSLNKLFLKFPTDIEAMIQSSHIEIEADKIKTEISFRIMRDVKKSIKAVNNPVKQISILIHKKIMFNIFIDTIIELYRDFYQDPLKDDTRIKFKTSEILCTYLADLEKIEQTFRKELHKIYMERVRIDISNIENIKTIMQLIVYAQDIIKHALDQTITHKSNIYQSMVLKAKMMRVGLVN